MPRCTSLRRPCTRRPSTALHGRRTSWASYWLWAHQMAPSPSSNTRRQHQRGTPPRQALVPLFDLQQAMPRGLLVTAVPALCYAAARHTRNRRDISQLGTSHACRSSGFTEAWWPVHQEARVFRLRQHHQGGLAALTLSNCQPSPSCSSAPCSTAPFCSNCNCCAPFLCCRRGSAWTAFGHNRKHFKATQTGCGTWHGPPT